MSVDDIMHYTKTFVFLLVSKSVNERQPYGCWLWITSRVTPKDNEHTPQKHTHTHTHTQKKRRMNLLKPLKTYIKSSKGRREMLRFF